MRSFMFQSFSNIFWAMVLIAVMMTAVHAFQGTPLTLVAQMVPTMRARGEIMLRKIWIGNRLQKPSRVRAVA